MPWLASRVLYKLSRKSIFMLTFAYQARDASGKTISGIQEALNEDNAINTLMTRGLMVLSLQQKSATKRDEDIR